MPSIEQGRALDWPLVALVRPVVAALFRLRVEGSVPPPGHPLLVAANHVSYLDPMVLGVTVGAAGRLPRFMTTAGVFAQPVVGQYLARTSVIRVAPGEGRRALAEAAAVLDAGGTVVIYPEGHVARGRQHRAKLGVAALAHRAGAPVLPVAQWGMQRGDHRLAWARRRPAAVVIGDPLPPPRADRVAADAILDAIRALLPRAQALTGDVSPILRMSGEDSPP